MPWKLVDLDFLLVPLSRRQPHLATVWFLKQPHQQCVPFRARGDALDTAVPAAMPATEPAVAYRTPERAPHTPERQFNEPWKPGPRSELVPGHEIALNSNTAASSSTAPIAPAAAKRDGETAQIPGAQTDPQILEHAKRPVEGIQHDSGETKNDTGDMVPPRESANDPFARFLQLREHARQHPKKARYLVHQR